MSSDHQNPTGQPVVVDTAGFAITICQVWHPRIASDPGHVWLRNRVLETASELSGKPARGKAR